MTDSSTSKHRPWMIVGAIAWILIIAFVGIRMFMSSRIPATIRQQVAALETTQLSLPRDWHKPADVPPPTVIAFQTKFKSQMTAMRKKHERLLEGSGTTGYGILETFAIKGLSEEERTSFSILMVDLQPLIDETSMSVRIAGYSPETDFHISETMSFLDMQQFAKLMTIVASEQAQNGKCTEAMESSALPLKLMARHEQSFLITHLIGIAVTSISVQSFTEVAEQCSSAPVLQRGLELLNELRPQAFPGEIKDWFHDELAGLRFAAAYGYPVDLSPQPYAGFIRQYHHLYSKDYYQWLIDNLPSTDPKVVTAKNRIDELNQRKRNNSSFGLGAFNNSVFMQGLLHLATGVDPLLMQHLGFVPNYDEAYTRAYVARAKYDLTRLQLTHRLAEMGTSGEMPTSQDSPPTTITAYLSTIPNDPFTSSAPFRFSPTLNKNYSIGPDKTDNKAVVIYDPTNGAVSVGDIWMEAR